VGVYLVTHNLDLNTGKCSVTATARTADSNMVQRVIIDANSFYVVTTTFAGAAIDAAFSFIMRVD
jgi:hypothetical protein